MKATFKERSIYFSPLLAFKAGLSVGSRVFVFSIKGTGEYAFHKADKYMEDSGILAYPVRITPDGKLYITPIAPPVALITASMRLSYRNKATINVEKAKVRNMNIFIFKK
ncbi:MAG: hypothetical protein PHX50_17495 [Massilibacteroides sp.]|nr:hypothetical protein [Massilibacteroides sp.]